MLKTVNLTSFTQCDHSYKCMSGVINYIFFLNRSVSFAAPSCHTVHNLSCRERRFSTACCDITSSEALRALRPFYLAVHPDLFPQHPQERTTNEDSLKKLNSYLDALVVSGCGQGGGTAVRSVAPSVRPKPIQLTFFVRGRQSGKFMSSIASLTLLVAFCIRGCLAHGIK